MKLEDKFSNETKPVDSNEADIKGWGKRHQQCLILFCCLTTAYSMRACMGVSLVAMTGSQHVDDLNDHAANGSLYIASNVNGTNEKHSVNVNGTSEIMNEDEIGGFLIIPPYPTFKWDKQMQDTMLSSFFWGYMILQIPAGQLVHHFGARYLLTGALFINSIVSISMPWAAYYGGWIFVVICRIAQGLSQACILPGIHTFLGKWAPLEERGTLSAYVMGGQAIGTVLGLPITGFIAASPLGWPGIFRFYGVLSGIVGGFIWWLSADSPSQHRSISAAERKYIETTLGQTGGKKARPVPWSKILRCRGMYAIIVGHIGNTWGQLTLYTEVPAFMDKVMGLNIKANGMLSALPFLMMWFSNFFFSWITDMIIVKKILSVTRTRKLANTIGCVPAAIGLIVLAYVPKNIYVVETMLVLICMFKTAASFGFYINHIDISPNYSGTMMSISNFASNCCGSMAPIAAGYFLTDASSDILWRKVFFLAAGLYFFTNLFYVVVGTAEKAEWDDPEDEKHEDEESMKPMIEDNTLKN